MRTGTSFTLSAPDAKRLRAIVADPKTPQKHVWRARIVPLSGAGAGTNAIVAQTAKSKHCVWRWQQRFMHEGVDGLLYDKSRPPGIAPVASDRVAEIVRLTLEPPPHEATHWTLRAMAKVAGVAASTVHPGHLEGARPQPPPLARLQAVQGSGVRAQRFETGSPGTRAGLSTSPRPRRPGSTRSRASSPS